MPCYGGPSKAEKRSEGDHFDIDFSNLPQERNVPIHSECGERRKKNLLEG